MKNILIYGHNGWIGKQFINLIDPEVINIHLGTSRVDDINNVEKEINSINNLTHIFSFIGRTHGVINGEKCNTIDYLEHKDKLNENIKDNLFAPVSLALLCLKYNIHLTYLGTGCIFEYDNNHLFGNEQTGFTEDSLPNFFGSSYSIVKGFTDRLMHLLDSIVLNVRIRMPITADLNERNFITKILKYEKICSIPNSMTVLPELLPYVLKMAENKITGTINLTNPGVISHNEILELYKEIIDPEFTWKNMNIDEQNTLLKSKRSNNCMDTIKLISLFPEIKHIKDSIRNIIIRMKNN